MFLLKAQIVKNSLILAAIYFTFLKNCPGPNLKSFNIEFGDQWKDQKRSYQVRENLALFWNLVSLTLYLNRAKGHIVTKKL